MPRGRSICRLVVCTLAAMRGFGNDSEEREKFGSRRSGRIIATRLSPSPAWPFPTPIAPLVPTIRGDYPNSRGGGVVWHDAPRRELRRGALVKKWGQAPRVGAILPVCTHRAAEPVPIFSQTRSVAPHRKWDCPLRPQDRSLRGRYTAKLEGKRSRGLSQFSRRRRRRQEKELRRRENGTVPFGPAHGDCPSFRGGGDGAKRKSFAAAKMGLSPSARQVSEPTPPRLSR